MIPNRTEPSKMRRRRGVMLTPGGLRRLQAAIQEVEIAENNGDRFTFEQLGDRMNLSTKTLSRLWSLNAGVDQKTLKLCFSAFNMKLSQNDYITLSEPDESDGSQSPEDLKYPSRTYSRVPITEKSNPTLDLSFPYPDGPVPLDCRFYIERPPIEALACRELTQPGGVIRIRAPKQMGKSSLLLRLLRYAERQDYYTVSVDCNQIDSSCLRDLNRFLRGFCWRVATELGCEPDLDDYWDEDIGSKLSCSFYFKNYLLEVIDNPVVLVLNEVDRLFKYPPLSQDFFPLLRSWYEEARRDVNLQKLRLVVVYSTEEYAALDINGSPFNIGLPLHLPGFTPSEVQELAKRHGLNWSLGNEVTALMELVGGHPFLIRLALYHICTQQLSLNQLLREAITNGGVFNSHLSRQWITLQKNPHLVEAMATVVSTSSRVSLDPIQTYKLESQGLIRHEDEHIKPQCELYRAYFKQQLSTILDNQRQFKDIIR